MGNELVSRDEHCAAPFLGGVVPTGRAAEGWYQYCDRNINELHNLCQSSFPGCPAGWYVTNSYK